MWRNLWSFIVDLVRDGFAIIGFIAAPLSLAFTLAKAFDVQELGHLREISYAWALAPLTIWFLVAYVRRWFRTSKTLKQKALQAFYVSAGPIITRKLPKEMPESEFDKYVEEADSWVNSCADWIRDHMGIAARERFLDRSDIVSGYYVSAINKTHSAVIENLTQFRKNLLALIESEVWG